jgi:hypothetical protein
MSNNNDQPGYIQTIARHEYFLIITDFEVMKLKCKNPKKLRRSTLFVVMTTPCFFKPRRGDLLPIETGRSDGA